MNFRRHPLLYFGPLTVLIEWVAIGLGAWFNTGFNANQAISVATTKPMPLPLIFGVTLSLVGLTYSLFSVPLRAYSRFIPYFALIGGLAFVCTGWVPYRGTGGAFDVIHNICSFVATSGYVGMVWLMRSHPQQKLGQISRWTFRLLVVAVLLAFGSLYFWRREIAYAQLTILGLIQVWTIAVVWLEGDSRT